VPAVWLCTMCAGVCECCPVSWLYLATMPTVCQLWAPDNLNRPNFDGLGTLQHIGYEPVCLQASATVGTTPCSRALYQYYIQG